MLSNESLKTTVAISQSLINQTSLDGTFHRKTKEKIIRAEVKTVKRRFNTITLTVSGTVIIVASILIILQITKSIFSNDIIIPIILCSILLAILTVFSVDYFTVKKQGELTLNNHLGEISTWTKSLKELQRKHTSLYNTVKKAFQSVIDVDSKYILNGFILRYYVTLISTELSYDSETLYKYLFLLTTRKNLTIEKIKAEEESVDEIAEIITPHMKIFSKLLIEFSSVEKFPLYFRDRIKSILEIIDQYEHNISELKNNLVVD